MQRLNQSVRTIIPSSMDTIQKKKTMGYYINPKVGTKEQWLEKYGNEVDTGSLDDPERVPVCLVDNGLFTAAGICYNHRELNEFSNPNDSRPKRWYLAPKDQLVREGYIPNELFND